MAERLQRVEKALREYDGDACRPEYGMTTKEIAEVVLRTHWDLAACFCPSCVLARAVRDAPPVGETHG